MVNFAQMNLRGRFLRAIGAVDRFQHRGAIEAVQRLSEIQNDQWQRTNVQSQLMDLAEISGMAAAAGVNGKSPTGIKLTEYIRDLELELENKDWHRQQQAAVQEFSRWGIQQIILMSQLYFLKNPLIRRGIKVSSYYVFGRGVEFQSDDTVADETIKAFLEDPENDRELGHSGLVQKEETLHTDGNVFFVLFSNSSDGTVRVRTIPALEMQDIICDPDDASRPWYYQRVWTQSEFDAASASGIKTRTEEAWYPDAEYEPASKPSTIGGKPVKWESPIIHAAVGKLPKWKFGVPDVYSGIAWARSVKDYLEDWSTIQRANRRIALDIETKGGRPAIAAYQSALSTTHGTSGNLGGDQNPPPVTGSALIHGPGTNIKAFVSRGATDGPEEVRRLVLMVCASFGLPETFFGDSSTGSLATARSLDRPTELKFLEAQERWRVVLCRICHYVLRKSAGAPSGKIRERFGDKKITYRFVETGLQGNSGKKPSDHICINIRFPALLEHDIAETIDSIVKAATLGGQTLAGTMDIRSVASKCAEELGYDSPEDKLDALYPAAEYKAALPRMFAHVMEPPPDPIDEDPDDPGQPPPKKPPKKESHLSAAVTELRKAVRVLKEPNKK